MNKLQIFTSSGTFNVPVGVSCGFITQSGGGGGANSWPGNAGGASQICIRMPVKLIPGGTFSVTVGAKGSGAKSGQYTNTNGGDSIAGPIRVGGGGASYLFGGSNDLSGPGGGLHGADGIGTNNDGALAPRTNFQPNLSIKGGQSCIKWWGGGSGGGAGGAARPDGNFGCPAVNNHLGGLQGGSGSGTASGAGGASSFFGQGAQGGAGAPTSHDNGYDCIGSHYGAGGGGASNAGTGGDGAGGVVWIEWIEP